MATLNKQHQSYGRLVKSLEHHRIWPAITELSNMASTTGATWKVNDDIEQVRQSYQLLCDYAIKGYADPERSRLLADIENKIRRIAISILRYSEISDSPRLYFSTLRYEQLQSDSSISQLIALYDSSYGNLLSSTLLYNQSKRPDFVSTTRDIERMAIRIFNLIWTSYPLSQADSQAIADALSSTTIPDNFKQLLVAAVTLGALEYFDEEKMVLLCQSYLNRNAKISVRALVGLLLNIWVHRRSLTGRKFLDAMAAVQDSPAWDSDLRIAYMELVRTRDTDRISRKLRDEIIPEMMRIRPDIMKNISAGDDAEETRSIEENPEWAEMLDKSGLTDKLRELNELQSDGSDVMMSTFAGLKGFAFFNEVANWFMPFDIEQSDVAAILDDSAIDIGELVGSTPVICDSDKYSIVLSLEKIPSASRRMMLRQFKLQDINLAELRASELNSNASDHVNAINKYVQDIYRFFNLFRRKSEFQNPFATPINLAAIGLLTESLQKTDTLSLIGEFYFKRGYYQEALDVFLILSTNEGRPSSSILQKIGYCYQQLHRISDAIEAYERSLLIDPDSLWAIRRLAQCYRLSGQYDKAIDNYTRYLSKRPDDLSTILNTGHCLLAIGQVDKALNYYFKVEYLSDDPDRALRPIAWTLFLTGDYERSRNYYTRIMNQNPDATDYLNMGHLNMVLGNFAEAINFYRLSIENTEADASRTFLTNMATDRSHLLSAGLQPDMIDLVVDTVLKS